MTDNAEARPPIEIPDGTSFTDFVQQQVKDRLPEQSQFKIRGSLGD